MSEIERLRAWMNARNLNMKQLSREMGTPYLTVYTVMVRRAKMTDHFRWRFTHTFGWQESSKIFVTTESPIPQEPVHA